MQGAFQKFSSFVSHPLFLEIPLAVQAAIQDFTSAHPNHILPQFTYKIDGLVARINDFKNPKKSTPYSCEYFLQSDSYLLSQIFLPLFQVVPKKERNDLQCVPYISGILSNLFYNFRSNIPVFRKRLLRIPMMRKP